MANLSTKLSGMLKNVFARSHANQEVVITHSKIATAELRFVASLADMSPAERDAQIKRRAWYQALAERQGIAEVEWQTAHGHRIKTQTIKIG